MGLPVTFGIRFIDFLLNRSIFLLVNHNGLLACINATTDRVCILSVYYHVSFVIVTLYLENKYFLN